MHRSLQEHSMTVGLPVDLPDIKFLERQTSADIPREIPNILKVRFVACTQNT